MRGCIVRVAIVAPRRDACETSRKHREAPQTSSKQKQNGPAGTSRLDRYGRSIIR
ncbi:hypothetical protein C7S17_4104 [Burkholderia thailandensis]|nr:hypothetical protein [Burkholderia thailandensis]